MSKFICPVCKKKLNRDNKTYVCSSGHSFDVSKDGYVNLLMSQQSSVKRHGDDKLMVKSRREFLSKGYYKPLCQAVCDAVCGAVTVGGAVIDVGCGEGYYTSAVAENCDVDICGVDISKDALRSISKSLKSSEFAVASAFALPFSDGCADCVLNIFAPSAYEEFYRVLKSDGILIKAVPLEEHLWGLKCALYELPYKNKPEKRDELLFELVSSREIKYDITINESTDIQNLFRMTPYYYKTGRADAQRLDALERLDTKVHFCIEIYKKR